MKKLLICSDSFLPRWDGIARFLNSILPHLVNEYHLTIIVPRFPGEYRGIEGVKTIRIPVTSLRVGDYRLPRLNFLRVWREVGKAELVWTQTIGPIGASGIISAYLQKIPRMAYIHSIEWELFPKSLSVKWLYRPVERISRLAARGLYNRCSQLLVPSLEVGELMRGVGINTPSRAVMMGVDTSLFIPPKNKRKAKELLGFRSDCNIVGYCGRLGREKDLMTLYRAFLLAKKRIPNLKLMIVGSGVSDWDRFFLSKRDIVLVGAQNNVVPFLQAMDVYVLPSLTETTSLSTLEAMSCGLPVIVTPVGNLKECIVDGGNGMFFQKGDSAGLALRLLEVFKTPKLRERLGRAARATIVHMYPFEKTVRDVKEAIAGLLTP